MLFFRSTISQMKLTSVVSGKLVKVVFTYLLLCHYKYSCNMDLQQTYLKRKQHVFILIR
jgi:hypothetical protein